MAHKVFECPHCGGEAPATLDELMAAFAVLDCRACSRRVYLTAGKLSNVQPGGQDSHTYDSGD